MNNTAIAVIAIVTALALFGAVIVTIPLQQQQAYAQAQTFTSRERIPVDDEIFVECAAGGEGEFIHVTGKLYFFSRVTLDSAGGFHVKGHLNTQGVSGTGLTTGDKYQAQIVLNS
jgi:hypothetical protein